VGKVVGVAVVLAAWCGAAREASADEPVPGAILGFGARAGIENPTFLVLLEPAIGIRVGERVTWHAAGAWSAFAGQPGGGSGGTVTWSTKEIRTGPTWWWCGARRCSGLSAELGIHSLRTREAGDVDARPPAPDAIRRDYLLVGELGWHGRIPLGPGAAVEGSVGLRLGGSVHAAGHVTDEEVAIGGLLVGLAVVVAL